MGQGFALALACLRLLDQARTQSRVGLDASGLARQLRADVDLVDQVLATLVQLDWVGLLSEPTARVPRHVLLIDLASTKAAPLMAQLLLSDHPHTQAVWARWQDWRLAELI